MEQCVFHEEKEATTGQFCADCYDQLRKQIKQIPAIVNWLEVNLGPGATGMSETVTGSREEPIPLRIAVLDALSSLRAVLEHYVRLVNDNGRHPYPFLSGVFYRNQLVGEFSVRELAEEVCDMQRWRGRRLWPWYDWQVMLIPARVGWPSQAGWKRLTDYLLSHLLWAAEQSWAGDFKEDVRAAVAAAHRSTPWREEIRHDTNPCSRCQRVTVIMHIGLGVSRCERKAGGCGREEPLSEYVLNTLLPETRR